MISLLKNNITQDRQNVDLFEDQIAQADEAHLVHLIYRFAGKKDEWFNLLLSLSNCISIYESLPEGHPYQGVSERLLVHLKNAIKISGRLNAGAYTLLNNNTLDQLPIPAGIMDFNGRIVEINQQALNIIHQLPQWSIQEQKLALTHIDLETEIHNLIQSEDDFCTIPLFYQDTVSEYESNITSSNFSDINRLYLSQIPNPEHTLKPYIYFCFNSRKSSFINAEKLKSDYQLTETEALIVVTLIQEASSSKVAKRLKLKDATIRGHLTNIYNKVGVSRKPELIRKVMLKYLSKATQNTQFFESPDKQAKLFDHQIISLDQTNKNLTTKKCTLQDGRYLSYLDISNNPYYEIEETIIVLHNMMGSAFEIPSSIDALVQEHNLRILVPERPGYGDSSQHEGRSHESFCQDLSQLLDQLDIKKVKVIAHSIGGAYALAMAEFMPERIERIAMVNAITRLEDMLQSKPVPALVSAVHQSLRFAPFLIEPILKMAVGKDIEHFYSQQLNYMRPTKEGRAADINLLSQPEFRSYSLKNLKQSAKQGIQIWSEELKLSFSEWPFEVTNNTMEYQFWHGDEDDVISVNAAIRLAKTLNTQCFFRLKYETHYLFSRHLNEVIKELITPRQTKSNHEFQAVLVN
jgi:pimeloyl-ACP methyl ester carboxylesterase/DNA-binding CsgD family transcriptional regulator